MTELSRCAGCGFDEDRCDCEEERPEPTVVVLPPTLPWDTAVDLLEVAARLRDVVAEIAETKARLEALQARRDDLFARVEELVG